MGFWSGFNTKVAEGQTIENKELEIAHQIANRERRKAEMLAGARAAPAKLSRNLQQAGREGMRQGRATFTQEQEMMQTLFSGGDGTFWMLPDSTTGVRINHTLNNSKVDETDETSSMFGFGNQSERSGLF